MLGYTSFGEKLDEMTMLPPPDSVSAARVASSFSSFYGPSLCLYGVLNCDLQKKTTPTTVGRCCRAGLIMNPDSFRVGRLIGSYGFMNITSYSGFPSSGLGSGVSSEDAGQLPLGFQDVGEGNVMIRLYEGRVVQGPLRGTPIIFKVYPGKQVGGVEADAMAANEVNAHAFLQSSPRTLCQNLQYLLGGFETKTREQWLAFRNDGMYSAADYAKTSSNKLLKDSAVWNPFETEQSMKCRRYFVIKMLQGAFCGLAFMHDHDRLHKSLGPASVILNTMAEKDADYLVPRLRDLAFSVDVFQSRRDSRTIV